MLKKCFDYLMTKLITGCAQVYVELLLCSILRTGLRAGLPDFFLVQNTKTGKIYEVTRNYINRPENGPSVHKIYQHLSVQDPPKFTQIWIFGLKTNHLATLPQRRGFFKLA
jgi:hypothetical protein